jgi:hypothetical protein
MAKEDTALNQDLNSGVKSYSSAHKHLQDDSTDAVVSAKKKQEELDRIAMESAKRGERRFQQNDQRIPGDTIFTK